MADETVDSDGTEDSDGMEDPNGTENPNGADDPSFDNASSYRATIAVGLGAALLVVARFWFRARR
ncbi:hypothetical protein [Natronosalvus rutilus]|uniref:Uncharacterized protein n=1 Tax=Natronosalvus rutilus TaxID=2953753 RepID=A0A9E7SY91_9EURY|nr:hypothetical protein [Natronosalvus rutilus]UTF54823.1 hypothetical protein NGM29_06040 [Natronosalvus rutilus]